MSITVRSAHGDNAHLLFILSGRFTFDLHREVADAVKAVEQHVTRVTVDLRDSDYMDSSALGMLIQMRAKLAPRPITLKLKKGSVSHDVLSIANFDKVFSVDVV